MPEPTLDTELTLTHGPYELTVSPYGASLRGLTHAGRVVITGYHGKHGKVGGQGDVLVPFPGRVAAGRYTFEGRTYQMAINDKEGPNAIHGFLRSEMWDADRTGPNSITFRTRLAPDQHPGYPFTLAVALAYSLSDDGLTTRMAIENIGTETAPVAAGFHPYFSVGSDHVDADQLHLPFDSYLEYDGLLPTGRVLPVAGSPYDFRTARPIGGDSLQHLLRRPPAWRRWEVPHPPVRVRHLPRPHRLAGPVVLLRRPVLRRPTARLAPPPRARRRADVLRLRRLQPPRVGPRRSRPRPNLERRMGRHR